MLLKISNSSSGKVWFSGIDREAEPYCKIKKIRITEMEGGQL